MDAPFRGDGTGKVPAPVTVAAATPLHGPSTILPNFKILHFTGSATVSTVASGDDAPWACRCGTNTSGERPCERFGNCGRRRGLTQVQLAHELGCTPSAVYNWERGRNEPKASQLRAMARLFGVSMDEIDFEAVAAKAPPE